MRKSLFMLLIWLILLPFLAQGSETGITIYSEPQNVTITSSTVIGCSPVTSSANSLVAWTLVDGSKQSTTFAKRWYLTAPGATYDLYYTYNSLTWTVVGIKAWGSLPKGTQIVRRLSTPDGVYVSLTFTTIYSGGTMPTVNVYFESEK